MRAFLRAKMIDNALAPGSVQDLVFHAALRPRDVFVKLFPVSSVVKDFSAHLMQTTTLSNPIYGVPLKMQRSLGRCRRTQYQFLAIVSRGMPIGQLMTRCARQGWPTFRRQTHWVRHHPANVVGCACVVAGCQGVCLFDVGH